MIYLHNPHDNNWYTRFEYPDADNVQSSFGHRPRGHRTRGIHKRAHYDLDSINSQVRISLQSSSVYDNYDYGGRNE